MAKKIHMYGGRWKGQQSMTQFAKQFLHGLILIFPNTICVYIACKRNAWLVAYAQGGLND